MRILVVDDEEHIGQVLTAALTCEGYQVDHVTNGHEALVYLHTTPNLPCIILLDLVMPIMNGWDFLRAWQHDPLAQTVPIVALSAIRMSSNARALGAHEELAKPFDLKDLVATVHRYCVSTPHV